jgi:adenosylcobinamide-GDP ribazoletransferase
LRLDIDPPIAHHGAMSELRTLFSDLLACLRFYSRLWVPIFGFEEKPHAMLDFARAIRALPLAGVIIALPAALVLLAGDGIGLSPAVVAALVLAASALTTGAFHEDGLADTADGFGGGATRERKLEIMRDSRIGSYGGVALGLSLLLRWAALITLLDQDAAFAAAGWIGAAAASRCFALLPLVLLPPARRDGAAYAADRPQAGAFAIACGLALVFALAPVLAGATFALCLGAALVAAGACLVVTGLSHRQIGGQTGDVAGAAQQVAEALFLVTLGLHL